MKMMTTMGCAALCAALWMGGASVQAADTATTPDSSATTDSTATAATDNGNNTAMKPLPSDRHWPQAKHGAMAPGSDERADMVSMNATALMNTLSEEKTEIAALAAQAAEFRRMGGKDNLRLAALWDKMRHEHMAASPALMKLTKRFGGNPMMAQPIKAPVLGDKMTMLHATHMDHMKAVQTSQARWKMTNSGAVKMAMHKRGNLARKHIRWMDRYMKM